MKTDSVSAYLLLTGVACGMSVTKRGSSWNHVDIYKDFIESGDKDSCSSRVGIPSRSIYQEALFSGNSDI